MKTVISLSLAAAIVVPITADAQDRATNTQTQSTLQVDVQSDRYISSAAINQAGGKLALRTAAGQRFYVKSVKPPKGYPKDCLVDRTSLEKEVSRRTFTAGNTSEGEVQYKLKATKNGNQTICKGNGSGCLVIIQVPDYDPDDARLPG